MNLPEEAAKHAQSLLEALNASEEGNIDRILIRQVHKYYYACQFWWDDDTEQGQHYLSLDAPSKQSGISVERSPKTGGDHK
jgi:hypothetical protein